MLKDMGMGNLPGVQLLSQQSEGGRRFGNNRGGNRNNQRRNNKN